MKYEYIEYHKKVSDDELLNDMKRVASENNINAMSMNDYTKYGKFDCSTISRRFGSWNNALIKADIAMKNRFWSEQELFDNIEKVWIKKGSQPRRRDMDSREISNISSGAYLRKFNKWSDAIKSFVDYIDKNDIDILITNYETSHKTKRDINLRLRFKIMQRDNFKCRACGKSPASDPSVELHVDHIKPWSKGGETEFDNLQTLCSKCNLGKSDNV